VFRSFEETRRQVARRHGENAKALSATRHRVTTPTITNRRRGSLV
jgi:hypothetical protein